jgi:hypothetical protein
MYLFCNTKLNINELYEMSNKAIVGRTNSHTLPILVLEGPLASEIQTQ